jgi:precorrin-6x reductase
VVGKKPTPNKEGIQKDMQIPTSEVRRTTMMLVLAGTRDGRDLAAALVAAGWQVLASAATPYGAELLRTATPGLVVREGRLDRAALEELLRSGQVQGLLDATHPFAVEVSRLAREAALNCGVPYLRWERPPAALPDSPLVHVVSDWPEAAEQLAALGARQVFLAVGVKPLSAIINHPALAGCRFTVRVLPVSESLDTCRRLGLSPGQIVAFQGPGTVRLNEALLEACDAEAFVVKESGGEGGTAEKVRAALNLNIPVVVVGRPAADSGGRDLLPEGGPVRVAWCQEDVLDWAASLPDLRSLKL